TPSTPHLLLWLCPALVGPLVGSILPFVAPFINQYSSFFCFHLVGSALVHFFYLPPLLSPLAWALLRFVFALPLNCLLFSFFSVFVASSRHLLLSFFFTCSPALAARFVSSSFLCFFGPQLSLPRFPLFPYTTLFRSTPSTPHLLLWLCPALVGPLVGSILPFV